MRMYTPTAFLFDHKVFLSRCSSKTSATIRPTAPRHCTTDLLLPSPCDVMRARATQQLAQYAEEVRSADWNSNSWGSRPEKLSHRCCYVTADATWTAPAHLMQPTMGQLTLSSLMNVIYTPPVCFDGSLLTSKSNHHQNKQTLLGDLNAVQYKFRGTVR